MEQIVFLDRSTITAPLPAPRFAHEWIDHPTTLPDEIVPRLERATICVTNKVPLREHTLAQLPKLHLIAVAATGVDIIDRQACRARGITVKNVAGYAAHSVAEHALSMMLALRRNLLAYRGSVRAGRWIQSKIFCSHDHPIEDLSSATLGIIGLGAIGARLATLAEALGMEVLIGRSLNPAPDQDAPRSSQRVPLRELLQRSDVVSLHAPLTERTRHLIDEAALRSMKPSALLINTARGALIDEKALAIALREGRIGGAGIDVLETEPPRAKGPLLSLDLPNLIVTPHVAWASSQAQRKLAAQLIANLETAVLDRSDRAE